jgi:hypothetical protein
LESELFVEFPQDWLAVSPLPKALWIVFPSAEMPADTHVNPTGHGVLGQTPALEQNEYLLALAPGNPEMERRMP